MEEVEETKRQLHVHLNIKQKGDSLNNKEKRQKSAAANSPKDSNSSTTSPQ